MLFRGQGGSVAFAFRGPRAPAGRGCSVGRPHGAIRGAGGPPAVLHRLPARPAGAGAPQLRSGPLLRDHRGGPGDQRPQGLGSWASREGTWCCRWTARKPEGPSHLLRILRSYETGESFKLDILRNRKRETVERPARRARDAEPDDLVRPLTDVRTARSVYLRPTLEGTMGFLWTLIIGLVVGAIAKLLMPGRDPGGFIVTMLIGVAGALLAGFLGRALGWYADPGAGSWDHRLDHRRDAPAAALSVVRGAERRRRSRKRQA